MIKLIRNRPTIQSKALSGSWVFQGGRLRFKASKNSQAIDLKADIVKTTAKAVYILASYRGTEGSLSYSSMRLNGRWMLDTANRLQFKLDHGAGEFRFSGEWLFKSDQVIYRLKAASNKRRQSVGFEGKWRIDHKKHYLVYSLNTSKDSLVFKGAFETESVRAKKGRMRYRLGIKSSKHVRSQVIALYGVWKISNKWNLEFELSKRSAQRKTVLKFQADYKLQSRHVISAAVKFSDNKPLGVELIWRESGGEPQAKILFKRFDNEFAVLLEKKITW